MPNLQTWPSDYHASSRTSAEESCTYNYSKTRQKFFSLKLIRSQANTTALLTIYQLSNPRPARTAWDYGLSLYKMQHWKVKDQAAHAQNSKTLLVFYKQQQSTAAMPTVYKNKGEKNLWSDEQLHAAMHGSCQFPASLIQFVLPSALHTAAMCPFLRHL